MKIFFEKGHLRPKGFSLSLRRSPGEAEGLGRAAPWPAAWACSPLGSQRQRNRQILLGIPLPSSHRQVQKVDDGKRYLLFQGLFFQLEVLWIRVWGS